MEDRPAAEEARPGRLSRPEAAFVGRGVAATALAAALRRAGWPVAGLLARADITPPVSRLAREPRVVLIAVKDGAIAEVAGRLADHAGPWSGRVAAHLSGAQTSEALKPLRDAGADVASWHPLVTLASGLPAGTPFFAEGDDAAASVLQAMTQAIGGRFERLEPGAKAAYHAVATVAGNLTTVLFAAACDVLRAHGVAAPEQALSTLARQSLDNAIAQPGLQALTGPVARGDAGTLAANVEALRGAPPELRLAHAALSLLAHRTLARERGLAPDAGPVGALLLRSLRAAASEMGSPGSGENG